MKTATPFGDSLRIPLIAAPMFLVSTPSLVIELCKSGVIGTFPALNARSRADLADWIDQITRGLKQGEVKTPFAVNLTASAKNTRFDADLSTCIDFRVPLVITSMSSTRAVVDQVHAYGGLVFHDVINLRHARKAVEAGVDGIIAVAAGAGGHGGAISPFALVKEIRQIFDGTIVLGGALTSGGDILAAQAMGADMAYMGTPFINTDESAAPDAYRQMLVESDAADVVYTPLVSGVPANFLKQSLARGGYDTATDVVGNARAWSEVWSAGHGVGQITSKTVPAKALCDKLEREYRSSLQAFVQMHSYLH